MLALILRQLRLRILFVGAIAAIIMFFTQGCSKVIFEVPVENSTAITTSLKHTEPEMFELSSSGLSEVVDESGTMVLDGSVGGGVAMDPVVASSGDLTLFTGLPAIHTSF